MRSLQAKWDRLTVSDLAQVRTKMQLASRIEERYGLPYDVAMEDVEIWAMNRRL